MRYSFGLFSLKNGVTTIPEELVDEDHSLKQKPSDQVEYIQAQGYKGGELECKVKAYILWYLISFVFSFLIG